MTKPSILCLFFIAFAVYGQNAKIDALTAELSDSSLRGGSSFWPAIELPADASADQILDRLRKSGFQSFKSYKILATQKIRMILDHVKVRPDGTPEKAAIKERITAVLIDTDRGQKIVLMHFDGPISWWTSVYNVP